MEFLTILEDHFPRLPRKRWLFYSLLMLLLTLFIYASAFISPSKVWWMAFVSYLIPLLLIFHSVMIVLWYFSKRNAFYLHLVLLLCGFPFINATFSLSFPDWEPQNVSAQKQHFTVISYNVRVFNVYDHLHHQYKEAKEITNWVKAANADIFCFQEYYSQPEHPIFDMNGFFQEKNYHAFVHAILKNRVSGEFGLAIFSKFPIARTGVVPFQMSTKFNKAIFADLLLFGDTVRVINMHLQSIHLDEKKMLDENTSEEEVLGVIEKLKNGFLMRAKQIEDLRWFIDKSPYPIILCGDLNDTPYSFAYQTLHVRLENAFEAEGNGLGFTYNGKLFFLRIDHQFFSPSRLDPLKFRVHREATASDHFPISVLYELEKN